MNEIKTTRTLTVSPDIIMTLIKAQAGTLGKGLLECVMNSIDAGATQVDIRMDAKTLTVSDNGKGFATREEILACFEVFGFKHEEGARKFGQFGLGRAQLWSFMSTVWHTQQFKMDVDVNSRGLDYDLVENVVPAVPGLRIEGKFYEPQRTSDIMTTGRELAELVLYVDVPIFFNGERINKEVKSERWTHETDDAWIRMNANARSLVVYNLGARIREYPSYQFGTGGVVVTKPGVRVKLNMARNDILLSECAVWKRIRPFLQGKSDEAARTSKRLTEDQLSNIATRFLDGEMGIMEVSNHKLIVDIVGGKHTIGEFLHRASASVNRQVTSVGKKDAGPTAEISHKQKFCYVMDQKTLHRFGARSVAEFMARLKSACANTPSFHASTFDKIKAVENWRDACKQVGGGHVEIPHAEWTKTEQAAMATLRYLNSYVLRAMKVAGVLEKEEELRELRLGASETARAWTDGKRVIWFNRSLIKQLDSGLSGAMEVVGVMVHEYLHDGSTAGSHVHDGDFYERFHNAMLFRHTWARSSIGDLMTMLLACYVKELSKRGVHIKSKVLNSMDKAESFVLTDDAFDSTPADPDDIKLAA